MLPVPDGEHDVVDGALFEYLVHLVLGEAGNVLVVDLKDLVSESGKKTTNFTDEKIITISMRT